MNAQLALRLALGLFTAAPFSVAPARAEDPPHESARPPAWTLRKSDDDPLSGYSIYTARRPGSDFEAYQLEATIDASPEEVAAAALRNVVGAAPEDSNMKRTVLRRDGNVVVTHTLIDVPLVADRDIVTRVETSHEPSSDIYRLEWSAIDSETPPRTDGVKRIERSSGAWTFAPAGPGSTRAIYESHTEIDGPMPAWLLNRMMTSTIIDQIVDLRRRVRERPRSSASGPTAPRSTRPQ